MVRSGVLYISERRLPSPKRRGARGSLPLLLHPLGDPVNGRVICHIHNRRLDISAAVNQDNRTYGAGRPHVGPYPKFLVSVCSAHVAE